MSLSQIRVVESTYAQLTLSHEVDESCDHENRMDPELRLGIFFPRERPRLVVLAVKPEDPVEDEAQSSM